MSRKYENKHQSLISFEKKDYYEFIEMLPRDVTISDMIYEYIRDKLAEWKKDLKNKELSN